MLQIQHIRKEYRTGGLVQKALDDVSLSLRDSEFVAILGPSGSGKTTLLNLIGGLDRYDSGDLIINGVSTKKYKDRDWDSYRNHTIGFVFQSYNLIPHQTILSNVELALTISGISRKERRKRAAAALDQVGLGNQLHKLPSQLSGGQMQRVAIARALVNDPDILLADEPTGALDSDTSIQVMDLLGEVAKDRLVVMVTHNPELAQAYATRIVTLKDGKITSDSDPFTPDQTAPPVHRNLGKASMGLGTALSLSFNNLWTKKTRTLLVSFAGSIGIIGIALILSLSTGVNNYIQYIEEDTLSEYPLQITSTGFSMTSLLSATRTSEEDAQVQDGEINVIDMVSGFFSTMDSNDLQALKAWLDSGDSGMEEYVSAIEYSYDLTPQIFRLEEGEDGTQRARQVNPDSSFSALGLGSSTSSSSLMSSMMSTNVFYQLPAASSLYENQYQVMAGRWPEGYDECVVVLTSGGGLSDFMLYTLGLRDSMELEEMVRQFVDGETVTTPDDLGTYSYQDLLGVTFRLVNPGDYYTYDTEYALWVDNSGDEDYLLSLAQNGEELKIVGVVQPAEDANAATLSSGIYYTEDLIRHVAEQAGEREIVQAQLADPAVNVFTGEKFGEDTGELDLGSLFSFDTEALSDLFALDETDLSDSLSDSLDLSDLSLDAGSLDLSGLDLGSLDISTDGLDLGEIDMTALLSGVKLTATQEEVQELVSGLLSGYEEYVQAHPEADFSNLVRDYSSYLQSEDARGLIQNRVEELLSGVSGPDVTTEDLQGLVQDILSGYLSYIQRMGYTDTENFDTYLLEYLQTGEAQAILDAWAGEHLQFDLDVDVSQDWLKSLADDLSAGYAAYAAQNGLTDPSALTGHFFDYLQSDTAQTLLLGAAGHMLDTTGLEEQISSVLGKALSGVMTSYGSALQNSLTSLMSQLTAQIAGSIQSALTEAMGGMGDALADAMNLDEEALSSAFQISMDADQLTELLMSMSSSASASYDGNLETLGWVDFASPTEIDLYPTSFESKAEVVSLLDGYNESMEALGKEEQVISYTDLVGTLMGSVTDIVNIVSYVLIAFVGISLIVSSIMIGVITYISVLERRKEIGILRAIGASKRNISQVFNAETAIIGLCAGLIGVGLSLLALIPGNAIIHSVAGNTLVNAALPVSGAVVLVILSVILTLIGGLIPSKKAAKSDPVTALRTD